MFLRTAVKRTVGLKIIITAVIFSFLLIMLFPVRVKVSENIMEMKIRTIELIERKINHDISYSSIAPSILHAFEIRNFRIMSAENPDDVLISIEKIRLDFDLLKFSRENPVNAFRGLLIVNSRIEYDSKKNSELIELLKALLPASDSGNFILPENFSVRGRNIDITVETGAFNADLSRLFFTLAATGENDIQLSLKSGGSFLFENLPESFPLKKLEFTTDLKAGGRIDAAFKWADLDIDTRNFESDLFSSDRMFWNIRYEAPSVFSLTKTGDNIPLDLNIRADLKREIYDLKLDVQDFIFNRHFDASGFLADYSAFGEASLSGSAQMQYVADGKKLTYSGDLEMENLSGLIADPLDLSAAFEGTGRNITISESSASTKNGRAGFSGDLVLDSGLPAVYGRLKIPLLQISGINLSTDARISTKSDGSYVLAASDSSINGLHLTDASAELLPYTDNIEFVFSTDVKSPEASADHIYSEGILQLGEDYYIQAMLKIEQLLVAPVIEALPGDFRIPDFISNFEVSTEMFISGTLDQLSFASSRISMVDRLDSGRGLDLSLSGNNSGIRISDLDLKWDDYNLHGSVSSDLSEGGTMFIKTALDFNGTELKTAGVLSENGNLSLIGDYGIKLNIFKTSGNIRTLSVKTNRLPLRTPESESYLSLNAAGFFESVANWKILVNSLVIDELPTGFGNGSLSLSAIFSQKGGNFYKVDYRDDKTSLHGDCSISFNQLLPFLEGKAYLNLTSENSPEAYTLVTGFGKQGYNGRLDFSGFPVKRVKEDFPFGGELGGTLEFAGTLSDPQFRISVETRNAIINNENVSIEMSAVYDDLNLVIDRGLASFGNFRIGELTGIFDLQTGEQKLSGKLSSENSFLGISSDLDIRAVTSVAEGISEIPAVLADDYSVDIAATNLSINLEKKDPWQFKLVRKDDEISVTGGINNEISCNFFEDGYFAVKAAAPFPVRLSASGFLKDGEINATISDIGYIFDDMQIPYLRFYEGDFNGRIRIQGPVNDPDFFGQLDFHNFVFKPPVIEDITEPLNTSFFFSGKELTLPATKIDTTNGIAYLSIDASMERWIPRTYDIKISVPEGREVSAQYYRRPFFIYGFCSGQINIYGDLSHMYIKGDLNALEGVFVVNSDLDIKSMSSPTEFVTTDLNIVTKENNQFFWPSQEYPIVKAFLASDNTLNMKFDTGAGMILSGDLVLKGGEIFYFKRNFYIKEGEIKFNNDAMGAMDPLLSTRAEIRDINTSGEMTRIYLIVDQSPLSLFSPRFESEPAMSTAEIISLLGGNIFNTFESGQFSFDSAAMLTADLLAQFTLFRSIEDGLKSSLGLDLLSIRSSFFSNLLENTLFSGEGGGSMANFARYLDNTTLFLGKYFTDDIFLQGMFQFDLYNDTGYAGSPEMNIDSEIKLEWEGPVANVELSFYPDFTDPLQGLNKTSLGLSWRFSY